MSTFTKTPNPSETGIPIDVQTSFVITPAPRRESVNVSVRRHDLAGEPVLGVNLARTGGDSDFLVSEEYDTHWIARNAKCSRELVEALMLLPVRVRHLVYDWLKRRAVKLLATEQVA